MAAFQTLPSLSPTRPRGTHCRKRQANLHTYLMQHHSPMKTSAVGQQPNSPWGTGDGKPSWPRHATEPLPALPPLLRSLTAERSVPLLASSLTLSALNPLLAGVAPDTFAAALTPMPLLVCKLRDSLEKVRERERGREGGRGSRGR